MIIGFTLIMKEVKINYKFLNLKGNDLNNSIERNDKELESSLETSDGKPKKGLFKKVFTYFKK
jgi:hypothetical protein